MLSNCLCNLYQGNTTETECFYDVHTFKKPLKYYFMFFDFLLLIHIFRLYICVDFQRNPQNWPTKTADNNKTLTSSPGFIYTSQGEKSDYEHDAGGTKKKLHLAILTDISSDMYSVSKKYYALHRQFLQSYI